MAATVIAMAGWLLAAGPVVFAQDEDDESSGSPADAVEVSRETEAVLTRALRFLATHQSADGSWQGVSDQERRYPVAMTSYAVMAFLATGQVPGEGPFGDRVARAIRFLVDQVEEDGLIDKGRGGHYMYTHGITTIALAEAYGMSLAPALRPKLDRLVRVIVGSQNEEGGWRYRPVASDADLSVTVLQVVALRAAKNSGIAVPQQTIEAAIAYVRKCHHEREEGFLYQPQEDEVGFARTAAAIYSLQVCGEYDDPRIPAAVEFLFERFRPRDRWFTYGNFYAAPALYMIGGEAWRRWYTMVSGVLLEAVREGADGTAFWDTALDPGGGVGPIYSTSVFTMILAIPHHYIPLYQR